MTPPIHEDGHKWLAVPMRQQSREVDFGSNWNYQPMHSPFTWRLSWICDTGELYAIQHHTNLLIVIATIHGRVLVESALDGWVALDNNQLHILIERAYRYDGQGTLDPPNFDYYQYLAEERRKERPKQSTIRPTWCKTKPPDLRKVYIAQRPPDGGGWISVVIGVRSRPLRPLPYHGSRREYAAPDLVFEWGYLGSGPADTSLAILADWFSERPSHRQLHAGLARCWVHHQAFKETFIAPAPHEGFTITAQQIADWIATQPPISTKDEF